MSSWIFKTIILSTENHVLRVFTIQAQISDFEISALALFP